MTDPTEFGHGSLEGVAAPDTANNVVTGTAMIPMLTFGIPGSNSAAIMLAANFMMLCLGTGVLGYGMRRYGFNILAMVLGLVLGFMVEVNLRRSLMISIGNPWVFFTRPISAALLGFALVTLLWPIIRQARDDRRARAAQAT